LKDICTSVHNSIIHNSQNAKETTEVSINRWTDKPRYIHAAEYLFSLKKEENSGP
jgi:hypothetical protein